MAFNENALYYKDPRFLLSGKDSSIFDGDGNLLCSVESWSAQVNFQNASWQAIGSPIQQSFLTGYTVNISVTEAIVEDNKFIQDVFDFFTAGRHAPTWTFASVLHGYDGSESRMIFRDCVPEGQLDLHNISVGDIIKRTWNLVCNQPPELQKLLSIPQSS